MEHNREAQPGRVPLPRFDNSSSVQQAAIARDGGIRRLRRVSNWTAAALIAGVAATSGYFAHANPVAPATSAITATAPTGTGTLLGTTHKPSVSSPVATSGGSGVTVGTSGSAGGGGGGTSGSVGGGGTVSTWLDN
jgi:hypothetical protein